MKRKKKLPHRAIIHYNIDSITTFSQSPTKYPSMEDLSPPHTLHTHTSLSLFCLFVSVRSVHPVFCSCVRPFSFPECLSICLWHPPVCLFAAGRIRLLCLSFLQSVWKASESRENRPIILSDLAQPHRFRKQASGGSTQRCMASRYLIANEGRTGCD